MATVIIPTPLRKFTNEQASVNLEATDVSELVHQLTLKYPDLRTPLFEVNGSLRPFINIFVNDDDIRNLQLEKTAITDQSLVSIVPAIAGG
jgi:molybdopterin converting factor small subunit